MTHRWVFISGLKKKELNDYWKLINFEVFEQHKEILHTLDACSADVVKHGFAPGSNAIFRIRLDSKLIDGMGLQIVNDRVTRWAGLVVPLPVLLTVTNRIVSE